MTKNRALPTFLIIGSQKSGTTTLYHLFYQHPEIFMPEKKEVNYFFRDKLDDILTYKKHFVDIPDNARAIGEASPGYICHPKSPEHIHKILPDAKLILIVRNPIERAYSQYWDNRRRLFESHTFDQVLSKGLSDNYMPGKIGYFSRGVYINYIRRYVKLFGKEKLLVLLFDDLKKDPQSVLQSCFEFLDVDTSFAPPDINQKYNPFSVWDNPAYNFLFQNPGYGRLIPRKIKTYLWAGKQKIFKYPHISETHKEKLIKFYKPFNNELAEYLGKNLDSWNK